MKISKEKCIACKACHPYCSVGAISFVLWEEKKKSEVAQADCVECGACLRSGVCPTNAIFMPELDWPRKIRAHFSNPYAGPLPGLKGAAPPPDPKLNEVTGRIPEGVTVVAVEVGRPGVGASFRDVQEICKALSGAGVTFDPGSSVTGLMANPAAGELREEILNEKGLNVVIHFSIPHQGLLRGLRALMEVSPWINTVFSIGLSNRLDEDGAIPTASIAEAAGLTLRPHAKTNTGLGRA